MTREHAENIQTRASKLKTAICETFNIKTVRGVLERMPDDALRETIARLRSIFDEVTLDPEAANVEDVVRYSTAGDEAIVRLIEREVLDKHHEKCGILAQNHRAAVEALLRCYSHVLRGLLRGDIPKETDDAKAQTANEGLRALGHCLRWAKERCPAAILIPSPGFDRLNELAFELIRWGVKYDGLCGQHSAYSRGMIEVEVNEETKAIHFLPLRDVSAHFYCTQTEAKKKDDERLVRAMPEAELGACFETSIAASRQGLQFDDRILFSTGAIDVATRWLERTCLPELAGATALLECTVGELRRVLAVLYVYSFFITRLEDVSDDKRPLSPVMPPTVAGRRRKELIEWLARLSGVSAMSVESILRTLTFDSSHPHVTLAQQPFIETSDDHLLFLPRLLLLIDLPRMYVSALNKTKRGRGIYDKVILDIESAGVEAIANEIRAALPGTFQVVPNRTFRLPDGRIVTPDLVIVAEQDRSVLIADLKYATAPFGPNDVYRDIEEMAKWKSRMTEYVASFSKHPEILGQHCRWQCGEAPTVFGLILLRWPFPVPVDFAEPACAVDWPWLQQLLGLPRPPSIAEIVKWAKSRPDLSFTRPMVWIRKDVQVQAWRYRYSALSAVSKERLFEITQQLAYELWNERGQPLWDELTDWHEAERQIAAKI